MATDGEGPSAKRFFSTEMLPARDRLAIWREEIARGVGRLDIEPLGDGPFRSDASTRRFATFTLTKARATGIRTTRTRELLADGNDDILLMLTYDGRTLATQFGREVMIDPTTSAFFSNAEISMATTPSVSGGSLRLRRNAMLPIMGQIEDTCMRPVDRSSEAMRLLTGYLALVEQMPDPLSPSVCHAIDTHVHDLVALVVGTTRDAAHLANGRGGRAARFAAIRADIARNLAREDLSAAWIAPRHRVSASHVRRLFEEDGTTFSEYVLALRLAQAHRKLRDPSQREQTISAIAFELGFGDLSYFNRTFRRRYGGSPSDVRAATQSE